MNDQQTTSTASLGLAAGRIVLGAAGLLAPGLVQRTCLMEEQRNESTTSAWRYFGSRALALGLGYLAADDHQRRHLDRVGLIVDTTDTLFLAAMAARGSLRPSRAAWMGTTTVAATAVGLAAMTRDQ